MKILPWKVIFVFFIAGLTAGAVWPFVETRHEELTTSLLSIPFINSPQNTADSGSEDPVEIPPASWTQALNLICLDGTSPMVSAADALLRPDRLRRTWEMHPIGIHGSGADGVRLADVDTDGKCDAISAYETTGEVMVYRHPGFESAASPWPAVNVGAVDRGEDAFAFDMDGDAVIDIVSLHEGDTRGIFIHWGPAEPSNYFDSSSWSSEELPQSLGHSWMFGLPMDVNNDGYMDLVAGAKDDYDLNRNSVGTLGWFEAPPVNKRELSNWKYHPIDHAGWVMSIVNIDIDSDDLLDLVVTDRNSDKDHMGARWLRNPGQEWTDEWKSSFIANLGGTSPGFMAAADFDNDGVEELLIPLFVEGRIVLLKRGGGQANVEFSSYEVSFFVDAPQGEIKAVEIFDVDLDLDLDIVVSYVTYLTPAQAETEVQSEIGIAWLESTGNPFEPNNWIFHRLWIGPPAKFDQIQVYDVDGDGDQDVMTTEENLDLGVVWLENPLISP